VIPTTAHPGRHPDLIATCQNTIAVSPTASNARSDRARARIHAPRAMMLA